MAVNKISRLMGDGEVSENVAKAFYVTKGSDDSGATYAGDTVHLLAEADTFNEAWGVSKSHPGSTISRSKDGASFFDEIGCWLNSEGEEV